MRKLFMTSAAAATLALSAGSGPARAFDLFDFFSTCACPPLIGAGGVTFSTPDHVTGDGASFLVGPNGLAQSFTATALVYPTDVVIDAAWTFAPGKPRTYSWRLLSGGTNMLSGTWKLDASVGSGSGQLRLSGIPTQGQVVAGDLVTFEIHQVEPSEPGESTLMWWAGDAATGLAPYDDGVSFMPDETGRLVRNFDVDLRLGLSGLIQQDNEGTATDICGGPAVATCSSTTPGGAGSVFYVAVTGPAGATASIRCWDVPGGSPVCDTTELFPALASSLCVQ